MGALGLYFSVSGAGAGADTGLVSGGTEARVVPLNESGQSGTLELSAKTMNRVRESTADELDDFPAMDPAGSEQIVDRDKSPTGSGSGPRIENAGVVVSSNSLSSERILELSSEMYQPAEESLGKTIISWLMIFLIGFGVGLFLLKQFSPEFFGVPQEEQAFFE